MKKTWAAAGFVGGLLVACGLDSPGASPPSIEPTTDGGDDAATTTTTDGGPPSTRPPPNDAGGPAPDAGPAGCVLLPAPTFLRSGSSTDALADGSEYRSLRTTLPGGFDVLLTLYRGAPGGFAAGSYDLACTPGTPCAGGSVRGPGANAGPSGGSITVATLLSSSSDEMTGSITGVTFRGFIDVPIDGGFIEEIDPAGPCFVLPDSTFDFTTPTGTGCVNEEDCGVTKVCSMASHTCVDDECAGAGTAGCAAGLSCEGRFETSVGYCARSCDIAKPCPGGQVCDYRICKAPGIAALGATCVPYRDVVSGCASGLFCETSTADVSSCVSICEPFSATTGCTAAQRCVGTPPICAPPLAPGVSSTALLDQPCTLPMVVALPEVAPGVPCADNGSAYLGLCRPDIAMDGSMGPLMCRRVCDPFGAACPGTQICGADPYAFTANVVYTCR